MKLYQKYSDNPSFCAFHKSLTQLLKDFLAEGNSPDDKYLLVSKYLHLSIVDYSKPQSDDDKMLYPLTYLLRDGAIVDDAVAIVGFDQIIVPTSTPEMKGDILTEYMYIDYYKGLFPKVFDPFFKWELGEIEMDQITIDQVIIMMRAVHKLIIGHDALHPEARAIQDNLTTDDPWQSTRGYGEDKQMAAYSRYMHEKLGELMFYKVQEK